VIIELVRFINLHIHTLQWICEHMYVQLYANLQCYLRLI